MNRVNVLAFGLLVVAISLPSISFADAGGGALPPVSNAHWKAECGSCHMLTRRGFCRSVPGAH